METGTQLNNLKRHVFFEFLRLAGRVFILVGYSDGVVLGNRGFTAEEKENGIVLVLNSRMNFLWDEYGINVTLVFGASPQKCFIPADAITAVYSPELNAQLVLSRQAGQSLPAGPEGGAASSISGESPRNVIKVDFTKKTKKQEGPDGK